MRPSLPFQYNGCAHNSSNNKTKHAGEKLKLLGVFKLLKFASGLVLHSDESDAER